MKTLKPNEDPCGTSLQGYIVSTRGQIESVFGAPTYDIPSADDKVTTEWVIDFDGVIGTIYDWKRYEAGKPEMSEEIIWNIGGNSSGAVELIATELKTKGLYSYPLFGIGA